MLVGNVLDKISTNYKEKSMKKVDEVRNVLIRDYGWTKEKVTKNIDLVGDTIEATKQVLILSVVSGSLPTKEIPTFNDWLRNNKAELISEHTYLYYGSEFKYPAMLQEYYKALGIKK